MTIENEICSAEAPPVMSVRETLSVPMIDGVASITEARALIDKMKRLEKELAVLCALSEVEHYFQEHPEQPPVLIGGTLAGKWVTEISLQNGDMSEGCFALRKIIEPWSENWTSRYGASRLKMSHENFEKEFQRLGSIMAGPEVFDRWRVEVERARLESSTGPGVKRKKTPGL